MSEETLEEIEMEALNELRVVKRDGGEKEFDAVRIQAAIEKAFMADRGRKETQGLVNDDQLAVIAITKAVVQEVIDRANAGAPLEIEIIQDAVENQLMQASQFTVARRYILYREDRKRARALHPDQHDDVKEQFRVTLPNGMTEPFDPQRIRRSMISACAGHEDLCNWQELAEEVMRNLYSNMPVDKIDQAMMMATRSRIEREPAYGFVAARLLLSKLYKEVWGKHVAPYEFEATYRAEFSNYLAYGIEHDFITPVLEGFDLERLSAALVPERDNAFNYLGMQTVYDRYLTQHDGRRIETPQYFWMRVAMGLSINEGEKKNDRAIEFYNMMSSFRFVSSTPTLFNAGTLHPQLSSCYLLTVMDDLQHIFKIIGDDAMLSKWAGGLGNDWTNVRATGSYIKGTNGQSQGIVPFLKVANDTAVAVNQGGKRKGAMCAYLETWHLDIEEFLDLRKNTGDDRRRTHDMHTANWIPDLFMKRVRDNGSWTLFSPSTVPDLHDLVGKAFEERYMEYERMVSKDKIKLYKTVNAVDLWRKMLTALFETGHPWITFKDPSNIRSPQAHVGVVHSSNLCTEILLNTSEDESAVCNLGSVNLAIHTTENGLDEELLASTVATAIRMLDNVIDINYYPTPETRTANMKHRPIGLGVMGFQDALYKQGLAYDSQSAIDYADSSMEAISYYAISASCDLAQERGSYQSFGGSLWQQGVLPIDSIDLLEEQRGGYLSVDRTQRKSWGELRKRVQLGMRNSNTMAIAPTATISNISGVTQSIEPAYKHLFVKSNLSGEFTVVNPYLVNELKKRSLWDDEMIEMLKVHDGSLKDIARVPEELKAVYKCAFEIEPRWLIEAASRRQKWIDMGQSLNLYISEPSGKKLHDMYMLAWEKGLKTTYYLRSLAATSVEKSSVDVVKHYGTGATNKRGASDTTTDTTTETTTETKTVSVSDDTVLQTPEGAPKQCAIDDPECEACQ